MSGLLLDTHVWLWFLSGSSRLPEGLRDEIEGPVDRCWISPISIWEVGLLEQSGRIRIRGDLGKWLQEARGQLPWREASINSEVALTSLTLDLPHRDPADRFLAATALTYDLELSRLAGTIWLVAMPSADAPGDCGG